jgi:hypothetical protein
MTLKEYLKSTYIDYNPYIKNIRILDTKHLVSSFKIYKNAQVKFISLKYLSDISYYNKYEFFHPIICVYELTLENLLK